MESAGLIASLYSGLRDGEEVKGVEKGWAVEVDVAASGFEWEWMRLVVVRVRMKSGCEGDGYRVGVEAEEAAAADHGCGVKWEVRRSLEFEMETGNIRNSGTRSFDKSGCLM